MRELVIGFCGGLSLWLVQTLWGHRVSRLDRDRSERTAQRTVALSTLASLLSVESVAARTRSWRRLHECGPTPEDLDSLLAEPDSYADLVFVIFTLGHVCKLAETGTIHPDEVSSLFGAILGSWSGPLQRTSAMDWALEPATGLHNSAMRLLGYWTANPE